ncbi:MAG: hypothetical protein JXB62_22725 [Pirellulales bacterium]|nr:hypothetical protein [Pirellulales bacterium]
MKRQWIPRWVVLLLIAGVLVLPIAMCVIWGVSVLLVAMGDTSGGSALRYIALGGAMLWVVALISLVVVQGLNSLVDADSHEGEGS